MIVDFTMQLKVYATFQESISAGRVHSEEVAFVLTEEHLLQGDKSSKIMAWGYTSLFSILVILIDVYLSDNLYNAIAQRMVEQTEIPMILIPSLLIVVELVVTAANHDIDIYSDAPNDVAFWSSQANGSNYRAYHYFIWFNTLGFVLSILPSLGFCYCRRSKMKFNVRNLFIYSCIGLCLIHICYYAFPTFLLVIVYPTKVIVVAAYFISHIFFVILFFSIYLRINAAVKKFFNKVFDRIDIKTSKWRYIFHGIIWMCVWSYFSSTVIFFSFMFQFLCLLVLSRASYTTLGPYTIISLLPTAAISAISWMLRKKYFKIKSDDNNTAKDTNTTENNADEADVNAVNSTNDGSDNNNTTYNSTGVTETTMSYQGEGDTNSEETPLIAVVSDRSSSM